MNSIEMTYGEYWDKYGEPGLEAYRERTQLEGEALERYLKNRREDTPRHAKLMVHVHTLTDGTERVSYQVIGMDGGMTFGQALESIKQGKRVGRLGWNGKGMFVYMVPPASYPVQTGAAKEFFGEGSLVPYAAYMALKGTDGKVNTWVPSVSDCLAEDWYVVGEEVTFLTRLKAERKDLADRTEKLAAAVDSIKVGTSKIPSNQHAPLMAQLDTHRELLEILDLRIQLVGEA